MFLETGNLSQMKHVCIPQQDGTRTCVLRLIVEPCYLEPKTWRHFFTGRESRVGGLGFELGSQLVLRGLDQRVNGRRQRLLNRERHFFLSTENLSEIF